MHDRNNWNQWGQDSLSATILLVLLYNTDTQKKTRQYCQAMFLELVDYFDSYFYMSPFCICKLNNGPLSSKSLVKTNYQEYHQ